MRRGKREPFPSPSIGHRAWGTSPFPSIGHQVGILFSFFEKGEVGSFWVSFFRTLFSTQMFKRFVLITFLEEKNE